MWNNFSKLNEELPEYSNRRTPADTLKHLCQCQNKDCNYLFDYRDRDKYENDGEHYAPCQGRCPRCGSTLFTHLGYDERLVAQIKHNYVDSVVRRR